MKRLVNIPNLLIVFTCFAPLSAKAKSYVSPNHIMKALYRDIAEHRTDTDDKTPLRYFTLAHIYNDKERAKDLHVYRKGLSKSINSLSTNCDVIQPRPVPVEVGDKKIEGILYAVNIQDYGWQGRWNQFLRRSNYPFWNEFSLDRRYRYLAEEHTEINRGIDPLIVRADWFINRGTQPPLYHNLLNIPTELNGFLYQPNALKPSYSSNNYYKITRETLKTDIPKKSEQPAFFTRAVRAGTKVSGVSNANRAVQRIGIKYDCNNSKQRNSAFC